MPLFYYTPIYIFYLNASSSTYLEYFFYLFLVAPGYSSYIYIAVTYACTSVCFYIPSYSIFMNLFLLLLYYRYLSSLQLQTFLFPSAFPRYPSLSS